MSNQTQTDIRWVSELVAGEWVRSGVHTLERLYQLADDRAGNRNLPAVMVRSTALNHLRERVPDLLPAHQADPDYFEGFYAKWRPVSMSTTQPDGDR